MNYREELKQLKQNLYDFSRRNPLVSVKPKQLWFPDESSVGAKKVYDKATFYAKEYGVDTTLEVVAFFQWQPKSNGDFYLSPLIFRSARMKRKRGVDYQYSYDLEAECFMVNPVIREYLALHFELELPENVTDVNQIIQRLTDHFNSKKSKNFIITDSFGEENQWAIIQKVAVGNFNYKKSLLGADFDTIIENLSSFSKISGQFFDLDISQKIPLADTERIRTVEHVDSAQNTAIKTALAGNAVIQGPPGTGKSHAIVALISAYLLKGKKVLFVSEKFSALSVVYERLQKHDLHYLAAFFNTGKNEKKQFYQGLNLAWKHYSALKSVPLEKQESAFGSQTLNYYPSIFNQENEHNNLDEFYSILIQSKLKETKLTLNGAIPGWKNWNEALPTLKMLEKQLLNVFHAETVSNLDFIQFNAAVLAETDAISKIKKRLEEMLKVLSEMLVICAEYQLEVDISELTKLAITASILKMVDNVQLNLLDTDHKHYKSFNHWAKKYQLLKVKVQQAERNNKKWTKKPSLSEITELMDLLKRFPNHDKTTGVLQFLRRNPAKLKIAFQDFDRSISQKTKIKLLEALKLEWRLKAELEEVVVKLKHNLNIHNPEKEIDLIFNLRNKLDTVSNQHYRFLLEHKNSASLMADLEKLHPEITRFNSQKRFLFEHEQHLDLKQLSNQLEKYLAKTNLYNRYLPEIRAFFDLPADVISAVRKNSQSLDNLNAAIAYQHLLKETRFVPGFNQLSGWQLLNDLKDEDLRSSSRNNEYRKEILEKHKGEIDELEHLLSTPAFKLNEVDKGLKKKMRKSRRLLFHEMEKQQRHLPVKDFITEAGEYLFALKPLWMMNPLSVSERLPLENTQFDVVIFDESSQIPLEDTIPAIYRAKQVVVVGDDQQMPPTRFFSGVENGPTILDHANSVWSKKILSWHYRSAHPSLIAFSNNEFYGNELLALPSVHTDKAIELVKVERGVFTDGKNKEEALAIANWVSEQNQIEDLLIIAFSKEQEKEITKALQSKNVDLTQQRIKLRNLENAQGLEAETVVLSIGYGYNEKGQFRMNFGPINQDNGANRLNVLFTRAIKQMVVFSSISANDFQLSENRGVTVLHDFLSFVEKNAVLNHTYAIEKVAEAEVDALLKELKVGYQYYNMKAGLMTNGFVLNGTNKIVLVNPGIKGYSVPDLSALYHAISLRFKACFIVLSSDIWQNRDRVKEELADFVKR